MWLAEYNSASLLEYLLTPNITKIHPISVTIALVEILSANCIVGV